MTPISWYSGIVKGFIILEGVENRDFPSLRLISPEISKEYIGNIDFPLLKNHQLIIPCA